MNSTATAPPIDRLTWTMLAAGLVWLYVPTLWDLAHGTWQSDTQAHGPMILAIACWLIYRSRDELLARRADVGRAALLTGWSILLVGCLFYLVGRSQGLEYLELGSLIWVLIGTVLVTLGPGALKTIWFPLFFMLFMLPLPGLLVAAVTMPMKIAVSYVAEGVLYAIGYPIARTGVIMQIGQYQLLVADACAGLHTLFTLEALGLLYLNLARHESLMRNIALAILIIPISFTANVIRVMVLSLVTYHFGDEAGQGFLHGFAGMVLFLAALILIVGVDSLLRTIARRRDQALAGVSP